MAFYTFGNDAASYSFEKRVDSDNFAIDSIGNISFAGMENYYNDYGSYRKVKSFVSLEEFRESRYSSQKDTFTFNIPVSIKDYSSKISTYTGIEELDVLATMVETLEKKIEISLKEEVIPYAVISTPSKVKGEAEVYSDGSFTGSLSCCITLVYKNSDTRDLRKLPENPEKIKPYFDPYSAFLDTLSLDGLDDAKEA